MGVGSDPELVPRAGIQPPDDLRGLPSAVCVDPLRLTGATQLLQLYNVLSDGPVGILRGLPGEFDGSVSEGLCGERPGGGGAWDKERREKSAPQITSSGWEAPGPG